MNPTEVIKDWYTRVDCQRDADACYDHVDPGTELRGRISQPRLSGRSANTLDDVATALRLDCSAFHIVSPYELHVHEVSPGRVLMRASLAVVRPEWSAAATPVRMQRSGVYVLRNNKVVRAWHVANSPSFWRQMLAVDAEERRRGWEGPTDPLEARRTEHVSRLGAFDRWSLPPRLRQVADLIIAGFSDKQIAAQLGLATTSVSGYVKEIRRRAGISRRQDLARAAGMYSLAALS